MNELILQIFIALIAIIFLINLILKIKENKLTIKEGIFWSLLVIALIVIVFLPAVLSFLANILGIGRPIDVFVYSAIVLLFYLIYKTNMRLDDTDKNISKIVEEVAIKKAKKKKGKKR